MKRPKRITSYRAKVFLVYLLITIIPILLFVCTVEAQYISRLRDQAFDTLDSTTDSLVATVDGCMDQIKTVANSLILFNETSQTYLPEKPAEANEFQSRLNIYVSGSTLFDEVALYSVDNEYLFSNKSSYTKERFLQLKGMGYLTTEQLDALVRDSYEPVVIKTSGNNAFCVLYPMHIRGETKGLFVSVPASKLNAYMRMALMNNEGYCQLTDRDGQVLFSYYSSGKSIPEQEVLDRCMAGERSVRIGTQTWYCASGQSTATNMSVSIAINDGSIHKSVDSIMWKWGTLIVASIALCFAASWVTSFINAKPIVNLSKKISSNIMEKEEWSNEIEHIDASIRHLNDFATTVKKQMDALGDYLTFRLLCGTIESVEEANQLSQMLGTSIYADAYQVCVVDVGQNHTANEVARSIRDLLPPEISSLTRAFDSVFVCVFFYRLDDQNTVDVLCERFLSYWPQGKLSFGNSYSGLAEIPISFMEAYLASQSEEGSVDSFAYSDALIKDIEDFSQVMESNDLQKTLTYLKKFYHAIETKAYTVQESKCICVRIFHMLSDSALAGRLSDTLPNVYIMLSSDSTEMLLKSFEPVIKELETIRRTQKEIHEDLPLIDQMLAYLVANYRNTNFSLQQMAFDFRLTPSVLSRYFKENYGRNINDYLNDLKMERAKQLLQETSLPVYEVGLELGYQGPNSFIRRFKATYGITPGEFRQQVSRSN